MHPKALFQSYLAAFRVEYTNYSVQASRGVIAKQVGWPVTPLMIISVRMFAKGGSLKTWLTPILYLIMIIVQLYTSAFLREKGKIKPIKQRNTEESDEIKAKMK